MSLLTKSKRFSEDFYAKGYVSEIDCLRDSELQDVKNSFNTLENNIGKEQAEYSLHNIHTQYPWVLKLATDRSILNPVKAILGEDVILLDSRFICKYPSHDVNEPNSVKKYVAWHQDVRYWGLEGDVVSVWFAVDDSDSENGCMIVIPSSHQLGILAHQISRETGNLLTSNQEIPCHLIDESKSVSCPLKAGQMSIHHGHLVHRSEANRSCRRRCGFVIRYVSTSVKPINDPNRPRKFESTVLVSGEDNYKSFVDNSPTWFTWRN